MYTGLNMGCGVCMMSFKYLETFFCFEYFLKNSIGSFLTIKIVTFRLSLNFILSVKIYTLDREDRVS
jgi:hypothetical protein